MAISLREMSASTVLRRRSAARRSWREVFGEWAKVAIRNPGGDPALAGESGYEAGVGNVAMETVFYKGSGCRRQGTLQRGVVCHSTRTQ